MNVTVTFRSLPSSDTLRDYAEEKVSRYAKYLVEPVDIHIVLRVEKIRQIAEVTLSAKGFRAHALEESQDMYTSIDLVSSKVEKQLRRHKEKVKDHKNDGKVFEAIESALPAAD